MYEDKFIRRDSNVYGKHWLWPKEDIGVWKHFHKPDIINSLDEILSLCKSKRTVIQAGGNCGIYPVYFSKHFSKVITFEPSTDNFYCLCNNAKQDNIYKYQSAIGNSTEPVRIEKVQNIGGYKVLGEGSIPQLTIDSFDLKDVDLIQLDVEGHEGYVIQGALETIKRCKPWIMLETKSKNASHSIWSKAELDKLMLSIGYEIYSEPTRLDTIYKEKL